MLSYKNVIKIMMSFILMSSILLITFTGAEFAKADEIDGSIELTLSTNTIEPTNQNVTITVTATDDNELAEKKWANGQQDTDYFIMDGFEISESTFDVLENGTYTVYVKDTAENETVETITVSNIVKTLPVVTFAENGNETPDKSHSTAVSIETILPAEIASSQYQWTGTADFPTDGEWADFLSGDILTKESGLGTYYLHIKVNDTAGNLTEATSLAFEFHNIFTVTFDSSGGSLVRTQYVEYSNTVNEPTQPFKNGYDFAGWYLDEGCTIGWDFINDTMPQQDLTLYAKWTVSTEKLFEEESFQQPLMTTFGMMSFTLFQTFTSGTVMPNKENLGFENDLTYWNTNGTVTVEAQRTIPAGSNNWEVFPNGSKMAVLVPSGSYGAFTAMSDTLMLSQASKDYITGVFPAITNASYIYTDLELIAGEEFTVGWNYVATDYDPFNDASFVSLVNVDNPDNVPMVNGVYAEVGILGATVKGTGNYSTGSYGSTGWQLASFKITHPGTYRLGFATYNLDDTALPPYLFVDDGRGTTYNNGVEFAPIEPDDDAPAPPESVSLVYNPTIFTEAESNDGSISTTSEITLSGDTFTGSINQEITAIQTSNVPEGLSIVITKTGEGTATMVFTGTAAQHSSADNASNITVSFEDAAFTSNDASSIAGAMTNFLAISFEDADGYEVIFNSNGGSSVAGQIVVEGNKIIEPEAPMKAGYVFSSWYSDSNLTTLWNFTEGVMPANNLTLYAKWIPNPDTAYIVQHYRQDVTGAGYSLYETEVLAGTTDTTATAAAKAYAGFSENISHAGRAATGNITPDGSLILKLYYDREEITVAFEDYDNTLIEEKTVRYEGTATPPADPTREGYTFTGWNGQYEAVTETQTVIAMYEINQYTITFDSAGGTATAPITQDYGTAIVTPEAPTKTGYTFAGWNPTVPANMPASNMGITATYTANPDTVYIVQHYQQDVTGDGYTLYETEELAGTTDTTATAAAKAYAGFSENISHAGRAATGNITPDGSLILKLYYDREEITVAFEDYDNTLIEEKTVRYEGTATPPADPTREGYTFTGWNGQYEAVTETQTVIAMYEINQYTVMFESNGGSLVDDETVNHGGLVTEPTDPSKSGYLFAGWYSEEDLGNPWDFEVNEITEDITIYAKWTAESDNTPVVVIVNGKEEYAGTEEKSYEDGKTVVTVTVDSNRIEEKIEKASQSNEENVKNVVQVPIADTTSESAKIVLRGDIVKKLEENDFDVSVTRDAVQYNIPAKEFTISSVAEKLGVESSSLKDIEVDVQISKVDEEVVRKYEEMVKEKNNELIFPPTEFKIVAKTTKQDGSSENVDISKFNDYVERVIEIPEGVDPEKITTGVVFNSDGSYNHVPTEVFEKDGKWYAKINSLTNSIYSVVYSPVSVASVKGHWSEKYVNDMASRLIITDVEAFLPDKAINRADFAIYIVNALGLQREEYEGHLGMYRFTDVDEKNPARKGITIANEWGIISGYPDNTFKPEASITREEAMAMYARAMAVVDLTGLENDRILNYQDADEVASWAYEAVKKTLSAGVFIGRAIDVIAPKGTLTYAEAATAIRSLLIEAELIDVRGTY